MTWSAFGWENTPSTDTLVSAENLEAANQHAYDLAVTETGVRDVNLGGVAPTGANLVGWVRDLDTTPPTIWLHGAKVVQTTSQPPGPTPVPVGNPPVFTTEPLSLLSNAAALTSTGFETDPSWTNNGNQAGITLQATDKPRSGTKSLKIASGVDTYAYKYKTFTAVANRRYGLEFYAWLASTANNARHVLGGLKDSALTSYIQVGVDASGNTKIWSNVYSATLAAFPRDQWVKVNLYVTTSAVANDTIELSINDVSWYSNTANAVGQLMDRIAFGTDYLASTTNLWIDDVVLTDPSSGTTDPGTSQQSGTAFKANSFVASNTPEYTVVWKRAAADGTVTNAFAPLITAPYEYTTVTADEDCYLFFDVSAANADGVVTARSQSVLITGSGTPPDNTPQPTPTGSFADLLLADRTTSSEAIPKIVNTVAIDWGYAPRSGTFPPPSNFQNLTLWSVTDSVQGQALATGTVVHIASWEIWLKSVATQAWTRVQYGTGVYGGAYYHDSFNNQNTAATISANAAGGTSVTMPGNPYNFHGYPNSGRPSMNGADVGGFVVIVRARLNPGYAGTPKVTMCASGDWWITATAGWNSSYTNNRDMGVGRFKYVGANMRMFTLSGGDLSTLPSIGYDPAEMF